MRGPLLAVAFDEARAQIAIVGEVDVTDPKHPREVLLPADDAAALIALRDADSSQPVRWVWWSTAVVARLLAAGVRPVRGLDLTQSHLLLHGSTPGSAPEHIWAGALGLDPSGMPRRYRDDLFDVVDADSPDHGGDPLDRHGYLRPDFLAGRLGSATDWARLALRVAAGQYRQLHERGRAVSTAHSESGAAVLALELERDGLPVHRATFERLITASAGPRPADSAHEQEARQSRDRQVLRHLPAGRVVDLRNPEQVRALLVDLGVRVESTRKRELEMYRDTHPVVAALLRWRADERIATTYGWAWLDQYVGSDSRLRGRWMSFDGGAGRMTASAGLHNLPTSLRPAVRPRDGRVFVRSDLGQIEPRVLAVVSQDPALTEATRQDDLYRTVAERLHVERPVAKLAVLSAMYGGAAGQAAAALEGLNRAYPVAMSYLRSAQSAGERGESVTTYGGRVIHMPPATTEPQTRSRGRFARNAVVQGAAAEFFKAWALTVRSLVAPYDASIVMCLHDELLLEVSADHSAAVAAAVQEALEAAARRWSERSGVRFVTDTTVIECWADAKP